jgi:hypothetical protein
MAIFVRPLHSRVSCVIGAAAGRGVRCCFVVRRTARGDTIAHGTNDLIGMIQRRPWPCLLLSLAPVVLVIGPPAAGAFGANSRQNREKTARSHFASCSFTGAYERKKCSLAFYHLITPARLLHAIIEGHGRTSSAFRYRWIRCESFSLRLVTCELTGKRPILVGLTKSADAPPRG